MHNNISTTPISINSNIFLDTISGIIKEKCFQYIILLFSLYITPIILNSNYYYHDDMCRAINGDAGWSRDGRPLAELFARIFCLGSTAIDVYPFPLFMALAFLALVFVLFYRRFGNNRPWIFSLCVFPILASPPFLDNLRWRFDSAFMVLSLVFAIFPYVTMTKTKLSFGSGIASLICAICLYQPALNVFIGAAALEGYYNLLVVNDIKKYLQAIALRISQFAIGLFIYLNLIVPYLPLNNYYKDYSRIISIDTEFFPKLFTNFLSALHLPNSLWQTSGIRVIYIVVCISFLIMTLSLLMKYYTEKNSGLLKKITIILLLGAPCIIIGMTALSGIIMFSEHPRLEPRVYLGWGMSVSFLLLPHCWITTRHRLLLVVVPSLCAWIFFILDFAMNNASKEEYKYRHNIALSIIKDLDSLHLNDQNITISGKPSAAPTTRNIIKVFPFIRKLIDKGYENEFLFINGSGRNCYASRLTQEQSEEIKSLMPLHITPHYKLYKLNNTIVVYFPESVF